MLLILLSLALWAICFYLIIIFIMGLFDIQRRDIDYLKEQIVANCYLFVKSPEEHKETFQASAGPLKRNPARLRRAPIGHVTVLFYTHIRYLSALRKPCMEHDFPLNASCELEMSSVYKHWGLETCALVRPEDDILHPRITNVRRSVVLIPTNVDILCDAEGCIKVTEPTVSVSVKRQRQLRIAFLSLPRSLAMLASLIYDISNAGMSIAADRFGEEIDYLSKKLPPFKSHWDY